MGYVEKETFQDTDDQNWFQNIPIQNAKLKFKGIKIVFNKRNKKETHHEFNKQK